MHTGVRKGVPSAGGLRGASTKTTLRLPCDLLAEREIRNFVGTVAVLRPLRPPRPKGPTVQLSVAMSTVGKARLDGDAEQLGIGRSALVTAVLTAEFGGPGG